jgi:phospholipase/carboxylesterase
MICAPAAGAPLSAIFAPGAGSDARLAVVLLHGFSMRPEDLADCSHKLCDAATFAFPRAPCAVPGGGFSWWPVDVELRQRARAGGARDLRDFDPSGRAASRALLLDFVREFKAAHGLEHCIVGGFSQGAMLACDLLLHHPECADGLVLLSGSRIAFPEWQALAPALRGRSVLCAHGQADPDLAFEAGQELARWLSRAGASVTWFAFEGGHEIPLPVWRSIRKFLGDFSQQLNIVGRGPAASPSHTIAPAGIK